MPEDQDLGVQLSTATYKRLKKDSDFLQALKAAGVDNWEGYPEAYEIYEEEFEPNTEN